MPKPLSLAKPNWPAVFAAYCQGAPHDEIAQMYNLELGQLEAHIYKEDWKNLRASLPLVGNEIVASGRCGAPSSAAAKMAVILENRETNMKIWAKLRDDLLDVVQDLRDKKLMMEKQFHNKGSVVRATVPLGMGDRVNLATYARTIADGTYRALGDMSAQEKPGQDASAGAATAPAITIILPGVISVPREDRAEPGQIIDLRDADVTASDPTPASPAE